MEVIRDVILSCRENTYWLGFSTAPIQVPESDVVSFNPDDTIGSEVIDLLATIRFERRYLDHLAKETPMLVCEGCRSWFQSCTADKHICATCSAVVNRIIKGT